MANPYAQIGNILSELTNWRVDTQPNRFNQTSDEVFNELKNKVDRLLFSNPDFAHANEEDQARALLTPTEFEAWMQSRRRILGLEDIPLPQEARAYQAKMDTKRARLAQVPALAEAAAMATDAQLSPRVLQAIASQLQGFKTERAEQAFAEGEPGLTGTYGPGGFKGIREAEAEPVKAEAQQLEGLGRQKWGEAALLESQRPAAPAKIPAEKMLTAQQELEQKQIETRTAEFIDRIPATYKTGSDTEFLADLNLFLGKDAEGKGPATRGPVDDVAAYQAFRLYKDFRDAATLLAKQGARPIAVMDALAAEHPDTYGRLPVITRRRWAESAYGK